MKKLASCALPLALALVLPAQAAQDLHGPARIGLVSVPGGQTLRLNVRSVAAVASDVPPGPCRVSMSFVDGDGRGVGQSLIALLRPGQGTRLDLPAPAASTELPALPFAAHPVVRVLPAVQSGALPAVQSGALPAVQNCAVAVSVEVLDAGGRLATLWADPQLIDASTPVQ